MGDKPRLTLVGPESIGSRPSRSQRKATKRTVGNFMFQPVIQLKIAAYNALVAALFSLSISLLFYFNLDKFATTFIDHTQADDATISQIYHHLESVRIWALLLLIGYVGVAIAVSLRLTQQMVGSTAGFKKHIRAIANGDYSKKISVRRGDAFQDVAEELNYLSESLAKNQESAPGDSDSERRRVSGDSAPS